MKQLNSVEGPAVASGRIDETDRRLMQELVHNGRESIVELARRIQLSPAATKRRLDRLEDMGAIRGYTAILDHQMLGISFEAFTELRFAGDVAVADIQSISRSVPEVLEAYTIAGDPDALVRIRVRGVEHLQEVVDALRQQAGVVGTKTLMVLGSWRRGEIKARTLPKNEGRASP